MTNLWYVVRSKPNKEDFLARQFEAYGIEIFYPRLRVSPVNPRARKARPYFPGYLFVHVDLSVVASTTLQWMAGAANLVNFGGEPATVPDALIAAIEKRVEEINASNKTGVNNLKRGEPVRIQAGPFAGYEAIFDGRISGQERVRVLLRFLEKREVALELGENEVLRVKRP
jgi:transcriptional antiterminator RfaH